MEISGFMLIGLRLLAVAALVAANGFFVIVEFSLVTARRARIQQLARKGNHAAKIVTRMQDDVDLYIAAAQLGITLASLALGWVGDMTIATIVEPPIEHLIGPLWSTSVALAIGTGISFTLITFLHIVLGEQAPKTFAIRNPEHTALLSAYPMDIFTTIFRPFIWVLDESTASVLRLFGVKGQTSHRSVHTVEELMVLVHESQEEGMLEEEEEEMLERVFEFGDRLVREAMIPRPEIVALEHDATIEDALQTFVRSRHSRFPVYQDNLDNIIGFVSIKDILALLAEKGPEVRQKRLTDVGIMRPVFVVPETRHIGGLFAEMRDEQKPIAIVIDEYGGTAGLVTTEELAEEVMGQVRDEWVKEPPSVTKVEEGAYEIDAQLRVDEINSKLDLQLPESPDYETVAGFLLYLIRHIPVEGEKISWNDLMFTIAKMSGPKIERVRITTNRIRNKELGTSN